MLTSKHFDSLQDEIAKLIEAEPEKNSAATARAVISLLRIHFQQSGIEIIHEASLEGLSEAEREIVILDRMKPFVTMYYEKLAQALKSLEADQGFNYYFFALGTTYKIVKPEGTWVSYKEADYHRTRRSDEVRGTLSEKEAAAAIAAGIVKGAKHVD